MRSVFVELIYPHDPYISLSVLQFKNPGFLISELIDNKFEEYEQVTLCDWLHETYFDDDDKTPYFDKADLDTLATLLQSMMQYCPENRPQASDLLNHTWFLRNPFTTRQELKEQL